jgi:alpha-beta hydrolase superfamily lysophospholipase
LLLFGHSTGGLITSLYLHEGALRDRVEALVLNSPFFDFNLPGPAKAALPAVAAAGRWFPKRVVAGGSSRYGESIHHSQRGEWSFDVSWKVLGGIPARAGWIRAIRRAQRALQAGLAIQQPILLLRSARSVHGGPWRDDFAAADSVLDVDHMTRYGPGLGAHVQIVTIDGALHDVMLSGAPVRRQAIDAMFDWLAA